MNPAWSVILFTTLAGAGQGLYLAAFATGGRRDFVLLAIALVAAGLVASFFHLGRPMRAWRAIAMWRTSWLSREVIALPAFIVLALVYYLTGSALAGWAAALACAALFVCTGMIYACLRFLQEWAHPLTIVNFTLLGVASGLTLAAALDAGYSLAALFATAAGGATRAASLYRNARLRPLSSVQSATGIRHPRVSQKAQGAIAGSFNTREFFHGRGPLALRHVKWFFLVAAFIAPAALLLAGQPQAAFAVQFCGLLAERWFFFAQANHPQNLYYQSVS